MSTAKALPGFRDFYPEDLALRSHIFRVWREVAGRYGFEEYDGPPLEPLELYTGKSGEEIVGQLYEFLDKGDRRVALRPEMTPTLARMVGARGGALKKPIRWFSIPQLFRYERQQRGRLREHFQLNCDLIGEPGPLADAEIIALAIDVMRGFGLGPKDLRVRVSDRRLLHALLEGERQSEAQIDLWHQVLDKIHRVPEETSLARLKEAGVAKGAVDRVLAVCKARRWSELEAEAKDPGLRKPMESLGRVLGALKDMGLEEFADPDLSIVRGLAYYTGTVFELHDAKGELRAICGGGRYDQLVGSLGGPELPCVGFGMGDVVLGELLKERGLAPTSTTRLDAFVVGIEGADVPHVLQLAHELRDAGLRVEYSLSAQAIAKQLRLADTRGARFAVVMGADERARGEVMLKDLDRKSQRAVGRNEVVGLVLEGTGQ
jgi:histidyl-tRNA synthetase